MEPMKNHTIRMTDAEWEKLQLMGGNGVDSFFNTVEELAAAIEEATSPATFENILGIAPDATGEISSEDFIKEIRCDWK